MEDQQPLPQQSPVPKTPEVEPKPRRHRVSVWRLGIGLCVVLFGLQLLANNFGWQWLVAVDRHLMFQIEGHNELMVTTCPGKHLDLNAIRSQLV